MFTLTLSLSKASLNLIKAELIQTIPNVKSSHRCQAIARGFGLNTYESLLFAIDAQNAVTKTADGTKFSAYLASHKFEVPPIYFYRAAARVAMMAVLDKEPKLTMWGIGVGGPNYFPKGEWLTAQKYQERVIKERKELLDDSSIEPFLLSLSFLSRVQKTKSIRPGTNSYYLKHLAENYSCKYPDGSLLGPTYVTNGVLITAAIHAGFTCKKYIDDYGYEELNVNFNMSKQSLNDLDCEIRPNGSRAKVRLEREQKRKNAEQLKTQWAQIRQTFAAY